MNHCAVDTAKTADRIRWDSAPVKITADEALRQSNADGGRKVADAKAMILEALSEGAMSAEALNDIAQREDISVATMRRARVSHLFSKCLILRENSRN
jgi:hypothetical protein